MKANPGVDHANNDKYSLDPKGPMNVVTWYHAAAYCNWLSRQERPRPLPECYEPNERGEYKSGMKIKPDALKLGGYRLPTDVEWEYACRAGAETSRYYGTSLELLGHYAWYLTNSQDHARSCGNVHPNELGLFDMLGNVFEWCQEGWHSYQRNGNVINNDNMFIYDEEARFLRGGSFYYHPAYVRSAFRNSYAPSSRNTNFGFRLSRTYP